MPSAYCCLGFPDAPLGSSREIGVDESVCFERHGRFGAYGDGLHGVAPGKMEGLHSKVNWEKVNWSELQSQCVQENVERFDMSARPNPGDSKYQKLAPDTYRPMDREGGIVKMRSAVIFRSYDGLVYTSDTLRVMRSVIMELALGSGGEYEAFLLVQVKDETLPIFEDPAVYEQVIKDSVPKEFWNMTILWNTALWGELYPKLPEGARKWVKTSPMKVLC